MKNATDAMKDSHVLDVLASVGTIDCCLVWKFVQVPSVTILS